MDPSLFAIAGPNVGDGPTFTNSLLQRLSNAAVAQSIYVVVNLVEKTTSNTNETIYYNCNLVFDRAGKIVAKYRKINLFGDHGITPGSSDADNLVTFSTDFGVTFGIFTCYDITYNHPARTILANSQVTDIIFPTAWISFLPFYHSLSIQFGYAVTNGVNLLAANFNYPNKGLGGSGIYGGDGSVFSHYISGRSHSKLLIATVKSAPRNGELRNSSRRFDDLTDKTHISRYHAPRNFESEKYTFKTLDMSQNNIKDEVCHESFCCQFNINVSSATINTSEVYKIMAYSGPVTVVLTREDQRICCLVACETSDSNTCATQGVKVASKFENILVETSISNDKGYYQPLSLTTNLVPVFNSTFSSTVVNGARKVTLFNQFEQDNLLVFGIVGTQTT